MSRICPSKNIFLGHDQLQWRQVMLIKVVLASLHQVMVTTAAQVLESCLRGKENETSEEASDRVD